MFLHVYSYYTKDCHMKYMSTAQHFTLSFHSTRQLIQVIKPATHIAGVFGLNHGRDI